MPDVVRRVVNGVDMRESRYADHEEAEKGRESELQEARSRPNVGAEGEGIGFSRHRKPFALHPRAVTGFNGVGRSPGLRIGATPLPSRIVSSGIVEERSPLTVAGAAAALDELTRTAFPVRPSREPTGGSIGVRLASSMDFWSANNSPLK
jgi:hypothetical protein